MSVSVPRKSAATSGLPRRVKLALVEVGGAVLFVVGVMLLVKQGQEYGLLVSIVGANLVMRPMARRLPRAESITDFLLRWRGGAGP